MENLLGGIANAVGLIPQDCKSCGAGFKGVNWFMEKSDSNDIDAKSSKYLYATAGSRSFFDFGYGYIVPELSDMYLNLDTDIEGYSQWDTDGGFIMLTEGGLQRVFNVPDAGNFLFGVAANKVWIGQTQLVIGADANEWFNDTRADRLALIHGWHYGNSIRAYRFGSKLFPVFSSYDTQRPSWFKSDIDYGDWMLRRR